MASRRKRPKPKRIPPRAARYARSPQPPRAVELFYSMALRRLVARWSKSIRPRLLAVTKRIAKDETERHDAASDDIGSIPVPALGDLTKTLHTAAKRATEHNKKEFVRIGIKLREAEPNLGPLITGWRKQNVKLVTKLFKREADKLEKLLEASEGRRYEFIAKDIEERLGICARRAELIARDQTLTLNAQINQSRQQAAGIVAYIWTTSNDERVRGRPGGKWEDADPSHWELDGNEYKYAEPPESGTDGEHMHPGEPINCRCVAFPVIPELDD